MAQSGPNRRRGRNSRSAADAARSVRKPASRHGPTAASPPGGGGGIRIQRRAPARHGANPWQGHVRSRTPSARKTGGPAAPPAHARRRESWAGRHRHGAARAGSARFPGNGRGQLGRGSSPVSLATSCVQTSSAIASTWQRLGRGPRTGCARPWHRFPGQRDQRRHRHGLPVAQRHGADGQPGQRLKGGFSPSAASYHVAQVVQMHVQRAEIGARPFAVEAGQDHPGVENQRSTRGPPPRATIRCARPAAGGAGGSSAGRDPVPAPAPLACRRRPDRPASRSRAVRPRPSAAPRRQRKIAGRVMPPRCSAPPTICSPRPAWPMALGSGRCTNPLGAAMLSVMNWAVVGNGATLGPFGRFPQAHDEKPSMPPRSGPRSGRSRSALRGDPCRIDAGAAGGSTVRPGWRARAAASCPPPRPAKQQVA